MIMYKKVRKNKIMIENVRKNLKNFKKVIEIYSVLVIYK